MSFGGWIRHTARKAKRALHRAVVVVGADTKQKTDDAVGNPPAPDE